VGVARMNGARGVEDGEATGDAATVGEAVVVGDGDVGVGPSSEQLAIEIATTTINSEVMVRIPT
jgi:hypothetical protein